MENRDNFGKTSLRDSLFVDWHLLDGLNHDCEYSHEPAGAANESYERAPLMDTAWQLLSWNRSEYVFHFYGGEPTIHPFFPDLFSAIARSGRNVRFLLDTNGLRGGKYFTDLLAQIQPGSVIVNLEIHPHCIEIEPLLYVVAAIIQRRQLCKAIVNCVPSCADKARQICAKLAQLRKVAPFQLELRYPQGASAPWGEVFEASFKNITVPAIAWPEWGKIPGEHAALKSGAWACLGVNCCHIKKNGAATLGLADADLPLEPCVMPVAAMLPGLPPPPLFPGKDSAIACLQEFQREAVRRLIEAPFVHWEPNAEIDREQRLLSALKHLPANGCRRNKIAADPELLIKRLGDILKAYGILAGEEGRIVFLGRLKAQILGDASYLQEQPGTQREIGLEKCAGARPCQALVFDAAEGIEALRDFFWRALWSQSPVEIRLPDNGAFLDTLLQTWECLPGYELDMRQEGMDTFITGWAASGPKQFLRAGAPHEKPLLSIILAATDDLEDLAASLEAILGLPDYEAIVILDEKSLPLADMVNEYVRRSSWRARPIFANKYLSAPEAWSMGIEFAQGEFACFLRCGDVIEAATISAAARNMAASGADIALEMDGASEPVPESRNPLALLMDGLVNMEDMSDKIYRSSILTGHAIAPLNFLNLIIEGGLNVAAFHLARKVLAIPGKLAKRPARMANGINFTKWLNAISHFCVAHGICVAGNETGAWLAETFLQSLAMPGLARQKSGNGDAGGLLLEDLALRVLFENDLSAALICGKVRQGLDIAIAPQTDNAASCICAAVDSSEPAPLLTVVVLADVDFQPGKLEEPLAAQLPGIEWLLIDTAEQANVARELAYLADVHANVRIGSMDRQAQPATCANFSLELARGRYIAFLDGDDCANASQIQRALRIVSGGDDNIYTFGSCLNPGSYKGVRFLEGIFEGGADIQAGAFIYDRKFFPANGLSFVAGALDWRTDFLLRALLKGNIRVAHGKAFAESGKTRPFPINLDCGSESFAAYDKILRLSAEWTQTARKNLEAWLGRHLARMWLAGRGQGCQEGAAQMPARVVSLLWRTLFHMYAEISGDNSASLVPKREMHGV